MAGKAKSVYLTITKVGKLQSVFTKVFFNAKSARDYVKTEEFTATYPPEEYSVILETY